MVLGKSASGCLICWVLNRFNCKDSVTEMLSALKWKTLESRRTIARLSLLYKMRNRLAFYEDIKLQPVDHLYSTRSKEYAYKQPIATKDYYNSFYPRTIIFRMEQGKLYCPAVYWLHLKTQFLTSTDILLFGYVFAMYFLEQSKMLSTE